MHTHAHSPTYNNNATCLHGFDHCSLRSSTLPNTNTYIYIRTHTHIYRYPSHSQHACVCPPASMLRLCKLRKRQRTNAHAQLCLNADPLGIHWPRYTNDCTNAVSTLNDIFGCVYGPTTAITYAMHAYTPSLTYIHTYIHIMSEHAIVRNNSCQYSTHSIIKRCYLQAACGMWQVATSYRRRSCGSTNSMYTHISLVIVATSTQSLLHFALN